MTKNVVSHPNFKGFMVNSAQTNQNAIYIVYGLDDPCEPMVEKEHTCYFHQTQSMDKQIK